MNTNEEKTEMTLIEAAKAAIDVLGNLIDAQNGPPIVDQADEWECAIEWECAMYEAHSAIDYLRAAIEAEEKAEPLFLLHTGSMYGNERDEYEVQADSGERVDRFCDQHPGQTFPLYPHPPAQQPARQPMTDEEIKRLTGTPAAFQGTDIHAVIRAVEGHHGIGEQEAGK